MANTTLTRRERDVLVAMADGLTMQATAERLVVSVNTVRKHRMRIFDRLGVDSASGAVAAAFRRGLVS